MQETILIVYLVVSIALIGIILLQQGKGAEMGASFGAGGANTVFGAAGSGNVLTKSTTILAILFFAIALAISYFNSEPADLSDAVLDESGAAVETVQQATSLEDELPVSDSGLEAETAPVETAPVETAPVDAAAAEKVIEEAAAEAKEEDKKD